MTDQPKPAHPKPVEIDVCSGPTLSREERLAFRPTQRPSPAMRQAETSAAPAARTDLPAAAE